MDPISMIYYGLVCGVLAWVAPKRNTAPMRFAIGVCVGLVAAAFLPAIRQALG